MHCPKPLLVRISPELRSLLDVACSRFSRSRPMQVRSYLIRGLIDDGILCGDEGLGTADASSRRLEQGRSDPCTRAAGPAGP